MNANAVVKVLIFEHHQAIETIQYHIKTAAAKTESKVEVYFATSRAEAEARLPHVDMVIVEVERDGRAIAHAAVQLELHVIATSLFFFPRPELCETEKLRLIKKPQCLGLTEAIRKMLAHIVVQKSQLAFAA